MLHEVEENAKFINTQMKIIFVLLTGKQTIDTNAQEQVQYLSKTKNVKVFKFKFFNLKHRFILFNLEMIMIFVICQI